MSTDAESRERVEHLAVIAHQSGRHEGQRTRYASVCALCRVQTCFDCGHPVEWVEAIGDYRHEDRTHGCWAHPAGEEDQ